MGEDVNVLESKKIHSFIHSFKFLNHMHTLTAKPTEIISFILVVQISRESFISKSRSDQQ